MRVSPTNRKEAERILESRGWSLVKIDRPSPPNVSPNMYSNILKWCEDNIGAGRLEPGHTWLDEYDVWYSFSWYGYWTFHFKREQDATAFSLRWI